MLIASLTTLAAGAVFAQMSPLQLRVTMISLGVKDTARSTKFYGETLGLELIGKPGEVTLYRAGDVTLVLNQPMGIAASGALAGAVEVIFPVESVSSYYDKLKQRGCSFVAPPHEVTPGMWAATFTDPDGHWLTVIGPK